MCVCVHGVHVYVLVYACMYMCVCICACSCLCMWMCVLWGENLVWGIWILSHTICKYFNLVSVFLWYMGAHSMIWLIFLQLVLFRYL